MFQTAGKCSINACSCPPNISKFMGKHGFQQCPCNAHIKPDPSFSSALPLISGSPSLQGHVPTPAGYTFGLPLTRLLPGSYRRVNGCRCWIPSTETPHQWSLGENSILNQDIDHGHCFLACVCSSSPKFLEAELSINFHPHLRTSNWKALALEPYITLMTLQYIIYI